MKRPTKSLSEKKTKRALDLSGPAVPPASPEQKALLNAGRKELLAHITVLQQQNMALHGELSIQHEKSNQALRMLGSLYQFMFGVTYSYVEALRNFKEAGNNKPIPAVWLAARVCERFEEMFDKFDVTALDMGPDKALLRNAYDIAGRPLNPGSKIAQYLGIQPTAAPEKKGKGRGKKA